MINDDDHVEQGTAITATGVLLANMLLWIAGLWLARLEIHFQPTQPKPPNEVFHGATNIWLRLLS